MGEGEARGDGADSGAQDRVVGGRGGGVGGGGRQHPRWGGSRGGGKEELQEGIEEGEGDASSGDDDGAS